jgi:hypothetical protein
MHVVAYCRTQEGRPEHLQRLDPCYLLASHRVFLYAEPTLTGGRLTGIHGHCDDGEFPFFVPDGSTKPHLITEAFFITQRALHAVRADLCMLSTPYPPLGSL